MKNTEYRIQDTSGSAHLTSYRLRPTTYSIKPTSYILSYIIHHTSYTYNIVHHTSYYTSIIQQNTEDGIQNTEIHNTEYTIYHTDMSTLMSYFHISYHHTSIHYTHRLQNTEYRIHPQTSYIVHLPS